MKRLIFQIHSWFGIVGALALLVIGLTGSALVFKAELDCLLVPWRVVPPGPSRPRLSADEFLSRLQKQLPECQITGWGKSAHARMADTVYVIPKGTGEWKTIYADGATGLPLCPDVNHCETVGSWLLKLHYTFFAGPAGILIVGIFGVIYCVLGITGVVIYRNFWKYLFRLRWKMSTRIFFSDLHKMIGISTTLFNLLVGITGAWWNLSHIFWQLHSPAAKSVVETVARHWSPDVSIDSLIASAEKNLPGFQANWISFPQQNGGVIMMFGSIENQSFLRSPYSSSVIFDAKTGEMKSATPASSASLGAQIMDSFRPLHFGNFGGLPVKILWCLGGLSPAILSLSGCLLWWKRRRFF